VHQVNLLECGLEGVSTYMTVGKLLLLHHRISMAEITRKQKQHCCCTWHITLGMWVSAATGLRNCQHRGAHAHPSRGRRKEEVIMAVPSRSLKKEGREGSVVGNHYMCQFSAAAVLVSHSFF
jgi:hypothetical protein